jgi:hypothetical protein
MKSEYTIRVRTPRGLITEVKIIALSYGIAADQARAYGDVLGLIESRYVR